MQQQGSKSMMVEPATWPLKMQKVNLHLIPTMGNPHEFLRMLPRFFLALEPAKTRNATVPKETDYTAWWMQQLIDDGSHFSKGILLLD